LDRWRAVIDQAVPQFFLPLQIGDVLRKLGQRLFIEVGDAPDNAIDDRAV
jgi:hypothetical protein